MFAPGEVTLKIDLPRLRSWFGVGPGHDSFLSVFPLSHETIALPAGAEAAASLQAEPEVGLACEMRAPARRASRRNSSGSTDRTSSSKQRTTVSPASCAATASCTPTASTAR